MPVASPIFVETSPSRLGPLQRRTIGDDVLDTLRKAVIAGAYAPGDHIAEGTLAQQLGVSRAPVREAMLQLEGEGLLTFDRRGAALVREFTAADFQEIFSLRLTLETMAARLACVRLTDGDCARLEANIERTRSATKLLEVTLLDVEFHDLVVRTARHSRLQAAWANLRHQIEVWLARMHSQLDASTHQAREETVRHHRKLLAALRSGRAATAEKAMRRHIEGWRRQFPNGHPARPNQHA
jgi:DNA-binding GntR family transcriptional regulator